jgi:hypothetical protein
MRNKIQCCTVICLSLVFSPLVLAKMPGFDIWLGDLTLEQDLLKVSNIKPLTQRVAYDNQPLFLPDGKSLLYTAAFERDDIEQTDSLMLNIIDNNSLNLTKSEVSEYSPTVMPDGLNFSVIRAYGDQQKLWRYPLAPMTEGSVAPSELLKEINPVGYHAWVDAKRVILFVLGEPHTLQLADIASQTSKIIDSNIGASLYKIPSSKLMSYTAANAASSLENPQWDLNSFDADTAEIKVLTQLPAGSYYYAWSADGKAIAAQGSVLKQWDSKHPTATWQTFADVTEFCPDGVSRLTINAQNSKIALVCALSE